MKRLAKIIAVIFATVFIVLSLPLTTAIHITENQRQESHAKLKSLLKQLDVVQEDPLTSEQPYQAPLTLNEEERIAIYHDISKEFEANMYMESSVSLTISQIEGIFDKANVDIVKTALIKGFNPTEGKIEHAVKRARVICARSSEVIQKALEIVPLGGLILEPFTLEESEEIEDSPSLRSTQKLKENAYKFKRLAQLLKIQGYLLQFEGNDTAASELFTAAFILDLEQQIIVDSKLKETTVITKYLEYFQQASPTTAATEYALNILANQKNKNELPTIFATNLVEELKFREEWKQLSLLSIVNDSGIYWGIRNWLWVSPVCRPLFNQDEALMIDITSRMITLGELPYPEAKIEIDKLRKEIQELPRFRHHTRQKINWLNQFHYSSVIQAESDVKRLAIVVDHFRALHGSLPDNLAQVKDTLGGSLPLNPLNGRHYHYSPMQDRYKLYAVIPDGEYLYADRHSRTFMNKDEYIAQFLLDPNKSHDSEPIKTSEMNLHENIEPDVVLEQGEKLILWRQNDWWTHLGDGRIVEYVQSPPIEEDLYDYPSPSWINSAPEIGDYYESIYGVCWVGYSIDSEDTEIGPGTTYSFRPIIQGVSNRTITPPEYQ